MKASRLLFGIMIAGTMVHADSATAPVQGQPTQPACSDDDRAAFRTPVDMKTLMAHVLTTAAQPIWRVNGSVVDESGWRDLAPRTDEQWEDVVTAAATLLEVSNALLMPGRARDENWHVYVVPLLDAAEQAYIAAEKHDLQSLSRVSDDLDGICRACHRHYGLE